MSERKLTGRAAALERRRAQVEGKTVLAGQAAAKPAARTRATSTPAPTPAPVSTPAPAVVTRRSPSSVTTGSPAREASRARRQAAAARGKLAISSSDRQRSYEPRGRAVTSETKAADCGCGGGAGKSCSCTESASKSVAAAPRAASAANSTKRRANEPRPVMSSDSGRLTARMRREAMSRKGKSGADAHRKGMSSAQLLKQKNPEISGRELARNVRAMRSSNGARSAGSSAPAGRQRPVRGGRDLSGTKVHHSEKMTGDEAGLCRSVTGTEYFSSDVFSAFCQGEPPKAPVKVQSSATLSGRTITTAGKIGPAEKMTGGNRGVCQNVTGTEYVGREEFDDFCPKRPEPGSAKVSHSQTSRGVVVSGSKPARAQGVTGNERGACTAVTGTPYAGVDQYRTFCEKPVVKKVVERAPKVSAGSPGGTQEITGTQPRLAGVTGVEKGACRQVSGTGYVNPSDLSAVCATQPARQDEADFPQLLVSASAPAAAQPAVTGAVATASRISGTFSMGQGKVTGTEEFRFGGSRVPSKPVVSYEQTAEMAERASRVTGEGISTGLKITGDDWDRGDRVTGTEGTSAVRRNLTRRGPISAVPELAPKRNESVPVADNKVTGSSGSTEKGALVTVSGGARG